ncbi:hypothetical protein QFC22_006723, partial [Naganishia vaughanmartiniae]
MSDTDSDSDGRSNSSNRIKPFKTSIDYPLWAKLVLNHLAGHDLLDAILPADPSQLHLNRPASSRIFVGQPSSDKSSTGAATITIEQDTPNTADVDKVESVLSVTQTNKTKAHKKNVKAYSYIFGHLHKNIIADLPSSVSDPMHANAMSLWTELRRKYGGGEIQQLVSTIDIILQTRIDDEEDPRHKFNMMRTAYDKLNTNHVPFDDKLFTLILLRALPDSYSATVQVLFTKTRQSLTSTEVIESARNYYDLKHPITDEPTIALMASNTKKKTGYNQRVVNPPGTFQCIYHPNANSHNTVDCRTAPATRNRSLQAPLGNASVAIRSVNG